MVLARKCYSGCGWCEEQVEEVENTENRSSKNCFCIFNFQFLNLIN